MSTLQIETARTNDIALMDPTERMVMGFLAKYRGATLRAYQQDLRHYLGWCAQVRLNPLTAEEPHIELYVRWMQEEDRWSESTIARRVGTTCGMYRTAKRQRLIDHNPAEYIDRPGVDKAQQRRTFLPPVDLATLIKHVKKHGTAQEMAYIALLALRGLRIAEACRLDISDFYEDGGYRLLRLHRKGGKVVEMVVPQPIVPMLEAAIAGRTEGPILINRDGRRMNRVNGDAMLKRLARAADVSTDISNHSLRRSFATAAQARGVPLEQISKILGHASIETTRIYTLLDGGRHTDASGQVTGFILNLAS